MANNNYGIPNQEWSEAIRIGRDDLLNAQRVALDQLEQANASVVNNAANIASVQEQNMAIDAHTRDLLQAAVNRMTQGLVVFIGDQISRGRMTRENGEGAISDMGDAAMRQFISAYQTMPRPSIFARGAALAQRSGLNSQIERIMTTQWSDVRRNIGTMWANYLRPAVLGISAVSVFSRLSVGHILGIIAEYMATAGTGIARLTTMLGLTGSLSITSLLAATWYYRDRFPDLYNRASAMWRNQNNPGMFARLNVYFFSMFADMPEADQRQILQQAAQINANPSAANLSQIEDDMSSNDGANSQDSDEESDEESEEMSQAIDALSENFSEISSQASEQGARMPSYKTNSLFASSQDPNEYGTSQDDYGTSQDSIYSVMSNTPPLGFNRNPKMNRILSEESQNMNKRFTANRDEYRNPLLGHRVMVTHGMHAGKEGEVVAAQAQGGAGMVSAYELTIECDDGEIIEVGSNDVVDISNRGGRKRKTRKHKKAIKIMKIMKTKKTRKTRKPRKTKKVAKKVVKKM